MAEEASGSDAPRHETFTTGLGPVPVSPVRTWGEWQSNCQPRRGSTRHCVLKRLEGDDGARIDDARDRLHLVADEMTDVDILLDIELCQDIEVAGGRVDLRGDLGFRERARDLVGTAERALNLNEERLHRVAAPPCRSLARRLPRPGSYPTAR